MTQDKPLEHQLHDVAHQFMDEINLANEHLEHAYNVLLDFVESIGQQHPDWADIVLLKAGKLQAAADVLDATAEEVHDPTTWNIPAFGDEAGMAHA